MTENIAIRFTQLVGPLVDLYLAEAQTDQYPYGVYTIDVTPAETKTGVHHYTGDIVLHVYSKDFDDAQDIMVSISNALIGARTSQYGIRVASQQPTCTDGIWDLTMNITTKQYK